MTAPQPALAPILEARDVTRRYRLGGSLFGPRRTVAALDGVSLAVPRGGVVGLVGESGSGKSTLARLLLGLERPDGGEILFAGEPVGSLSRRVLARRVQPVFQDPYGSLNPSHEIADIVSLPLRVHRIGDAASRRRRVRELLDKVGLPERLARARPRELSGGQRQRVALARALAVGPEVLVCDEPTSALDVSVQAQILNLLQDLRRDTGVAMLFISHDLGVVRHLADDVAILYLGRVVETGPAAAVFDAPRHPYTRALTASVLHVGEGSGLPDVPLGTAAPAASPGGCRFRPRCPVAVDACRSTDPALEPVAARRRSACLREAGTSALPGGGAVASS